MLNLLRIVECGVFLVDLKISINKDFDLHTVEYNSDLQTIGFVCGRPTPMT